MGEIDEIEWRSDPKQTSARYDEVLRLRMMLFDIREQLTAVKNPIAQRVREQIQIKAIEWGKEGGCV